MISENVYDTVNIVRGEDFSSKLPVATTKNSSALGFSKMYHTFKSLKSCMLSSKLYLESSLNQKVAAAN